MGADQLGRLPYPIPPRSCAHARRPRLVTHRRLHQLRPTAYRGDRRFHVSLPPSHESSQQRLRLSSPCFALKFGSSECAADVANLATRGSGFAFEPPSLRRRWRAWSGRVGGFPNFNKPV
jgi:hypothetical protein